MLRINTIVNSRFQQRKYKRKSQVFKMKKIEVVCQI